MIRVVAVNIGKARDIDAKSGRTGIFKTPQDGPVSVGPKGLAGDTIVDVKHHGGPAQAVYAYCCADAAWWADQLGHPVPPGYFGENLTLDGIASQDFALGDRLVFGDLQLRVTSPRIPCVTLERRVGVKGFAARFHKAARPGPYFAVEAPGPVVAGMAATLQPFAGARIEIARLMQANWVRVLSPEERAALPATRPHPDILASLSAS